MRRVIIAHSSREGGADDSPTPTEFFQEFGVQPAPYLSENESPPLDRSKLRALAERTLGEAEARVVCELMVRYQSWREAYADELKQLLDSSIH